MTTCDSSKLWFFILYAKSYEYLSSTKVTSVYSGLRFDNGTIVFSEYLCLTKINFEVQEETSERKSLNSLDYSPVPEITDAP